LQLPNVFCVGGSWMVTGDDLAQQNWPAIRAAAATCVQKP